MDLAALVALRQPVQIDVAGTEITVPVCDIGTWIVSLEEPIPLFPLLDYDEAIALNGRLYDHEDPLDLDALHRTWQEALSAQTGMPWWVASRLLALCLAQWTELAGELALAGQDALLMPVDMALAATIAMTRRGSNEQEQHTFDAWLHAVPPEAGGDGEPAPRWTAEDEGADFLRAVASPGARRSPARP